MNSQTITPPVSAGLQAGTTPVDILVESLETRWKGFSAEMRRCKQEASEEAVHDLRVATRRLLAMVEALRAIVPHPRLQRLRRFLKDLLNFFDDLRDIQVMLVYAAESVAELPEIQPFEEFLKKREARLLRWTAKKIRGLKAGNLAKRIGSTRAALAQEATRLDLLLLQTIDDAYSTVLHRTSRLDLARTTSIHRLRIAFKKFRYLVEIGFPLLSDYPTELFGSMHEYQGAMGDVQDVEILLAHLAEFAASRPAFGHEAVRGYFERQHAEAVESFRKIQPQVVSFWRPTPDGAYPWRADPAATRPEKLSAARRNKPAATKTRQPDK